MKRLVLTAGLYRQLDRLIGRHYPRCISNIPVSITHSVCIRGLAQENDSSIAELERFLQQRPAGLVAIGECGLDGAIDVPMSLQIDMLEKQLVLASQYQLPVILHCRKAYNELLRIVKQYSLPRGGVWHAFSGSRQQAEQFIELGFMLGIGGVITYERAEKTRKAVAKLPVESLLLETDGPTMPLAGRQGERNEPDYLPEVLQELSLLRGSALEALIRQTELNAEKMFRFSCWDNTYH